MEAADNWELRDDRVDFINTFVSSICITDTNNKKYTDYVLGFPLEVLTVLQDRFVPNMSKLRLL